MSSTSRKRIVLGALIVACTLCVGIAVRGELRRNAPEPEHCVLCDSGYTCHAPALLNLATGEIAELEVYALDPRLPDEVDKTRTGFMRLSYGAGVQVCMDAGRSASVILPNKQGPINYALYCRSCRALLETVGTKGYALLVTSTPPKRWQSTLRGRERSAPSTAIPLLCIERPSQPIPEGRPRSWKCW